MKKNNKILFHVLIPMIIGGFIYIIFREKNLLMFNWFNFVGCENLVDFLRYNFSKYYIPNWLLFNYPDGIWIYSFVSFMLIIWNGVKSNTKFVWLAIAPILGISAEIGQYINIIPGTYDKFDLMFCLLGSLLPFIFIKQMEEKSSDTGTIYIQGNSKKIV